MIDVTVGYIEFNLSVVVFVLMSERYYPPYKQLLGLHKLLAVLSSGKIYWHDIEMRGETILIRTEPLKGEFDLRVFYVYNDGEVDNDDFRELRD